MRRITLSAVGLCLLLSSGFAVAQTSFQPSLVRADGGGSVDWSEWLSEHGSTAVVLWASWLPEAQRNLEGLSEIRIIAEESKLDFLVIALQEPIEASRKVLGSTDLPWFHDRHGTMLKHLLVYQIPTVVVIHKDGMVLARLPADPAALKHWAISK